MCILLVAGDSSNRSQRRNKCIKTLIRFAHFYILQLHQIRCAHFLRPVFKLSETNRAIRCRSTFVSSDSHFYSEIPLRDGMNKFPLCLPFISSCFVILSIFLMSSCLCYFFIFLPRLLILSDLIQVLSTPVLDPSSVAFSSLVSLCLCFVHSRPDFFSSSCVVLS